MQRWNNRWKGEILHTILNLVRPYNGIDLLKLLFLEELYEKTFVVLYVSNDEIPNSGKIVEAVVRTILKSKL